MSIARNAVAGNATTAARASDVAEGYVELKRSQLDENAAADKQQTGPEGMWKERQG